MTDDRIKTFQDKIDAVLAAVDRERIRGVLNPADLLTLANVVETCVRAENALGDGSPAVGRLGFAQPVDYVTKAE